MIDSIKTALLDKLDQHSKDMLSGAAVSFAIRIFGAAMQFIFNVILARMLGADGLGVYSLTLSISLITSVIGRMGMDFSILRHVATHHAKSEWGPLKQGWFRMICYALVISLVVSGLLFFLAPLISREVFSNPELTTPLQWMSLSIVPFSLINLYAESLRAIKRIGASSLIQTGVIPSLCILIFYILYFTGLKINAAIFAYVLSNVITVLVAYFLWKRFLPELHLAHAQNGPSVKKIFQTSIPMAWVSIAAVIMGLADTVILGIFSSANEVGIYTAALRVSLLFSFVLIAVNSILAPKFASMYQLGEYLAIERLAQFATKTMLLLVIPVVVIIIFLAEELMLIFGAQFQLGTTPLVILIFGQLFNISIGSVGILLMMTGNERRMQWINLTAVTCNIILSFLLIPKFGMVGAAISSAVSLVLLNIIALYCTLKYIGVSTIPGVHIASSK